VASTTGAPATICEGLSMIFVYILGKIAIVVIMIYNLIHPERF